MFIEPLIESEADYAALGMNFKLISPVRYTSRFKCLRVFIFSNI